MNLRDRLGMLHGRAAQPAVPVAHADLAERVARMAGSARKQSGDEAEIARQLQGTRLADGVIRIERSYPLATRHGKQTLAGFCSAPLEFLDTAGPVEKMVFLDTETSGLAGGTGTIAFLLGMARITDNELQLCQWLLLGFRGEAAMLDDARAWLGPGHGLVSFNGKTFDIPLLLGRHRMRGIPEPFSGLPHLDLVHPLRRAYGGIWEDCRLQTAERKLLGVHREDDLPGAAVPEVWTRFLRHGTLERMPAVLEHNRIDLLTLPVLAAALAALYADPADERCNALAIAERHVDAGRESHAARLLEERQFLLDEAGLLALARLYRRAARNADALRIWLALSERGSAAAFEKLAKYYEHVVQDYVLALTYAERLASSAETDLARHRLDRLHRKLQGRRLILA